MTSPRAETALATADTVLGMPVSKPLSTVKLTGFRSFRSAELELAPINVLIGPNGAGKSNFLDVFDMVGAISDQRLGAWLAAQGGADRVFFGGLSTTKSMSVRLEFGGAGQGYEATLAGAVGGGAYFESEIAWGTGARYSSPYIQDLGSGHAESRLPDEVSSHPTGVCAWSSEALHGWRRYHFHDTSDSAGVKQAQPIADNEVLRRDGANLAAFLHRLRKTGDPAVLRIRDALRNVAPFFDDFILGPDGIVPTDIRLRWRHTDSDMYADASTLSDGSLRYLLLATVLLQPQPPRVILIDEPELGLHPAAIAGLADLMRSASTRAQVVVSTQSVTLLDQMTSDTIVIAERHEGATVLDRLDTSGLDTWLETYSVGDLWEKGQLGARPRFAG